MKPEVQKSWSLEIDYSRALCLGADEKARGLWERDWTQRLVGTASMRSMTLLQVDRCSNEPFSTYCVFNKLRLRILRVLQIVILEYCVYCVFYKLTSANIAYIAYIALRILRNIALRCVFYNKPKYLSPAKIKGRLWRIVALWLDLSQTKVVWVCTLARVILLCSWTQHL